MKWLFLLVWVTAQAADRPLEASSEELVRLRKQIVRLEERISHERNSEKNVKRRVIAIQKLQKLQHLEKNLGHERLSHLERTLKDLQEKKEVFQRKILIQEETIRRSLKSVEVAHREEFIERLSSLQLPELEKLEAPRRRVLARLVDRGIREIKTLRSDIAEAGHLQGKIEQEKQQLTVLFNDLKEQENVLELNRRVELELLKKKQDERVSYLENYRKLKSSQAQVEELLHKFDAKKEISSAVKTESALNRGSPTFAQLKGKLRSPLSEGKIASQFGKSFDARSGLYVFKKGVDIVGHRNQAVFAVSSGKIVFSGILPEYGQTVIIDHGNHYYSLCAHLGQVNRPQNTWVTEGESIGATDENGTPLYFEIRSRNVAVNPLQWMNI